MGCFALILFGTAGFFASVFIASELGLEPHFSQALWGIGLGVGAYIFQSVFRTKRKRSALVNYGRNKGYSYDFIEKSDGGNCYGVDVNQCRAVFRVGRRIVDIPWGDIVNVKWQPMKVLGCSESILSFTLRDIERPQIILRYSGNWAEARFARLQAAGIISG